MSQLAKAVSKFLFVVNAVLTCLDILNRVWMSEVGTMTSVRHATGNALWIRIIASSLLLALALLACAVVLNALIVFV